VPELLRWFREHGYQVVVDQETSAYASGPEVVERIAKIRNRNSRQVRVKKAGPLRAGLRSSCGLLFAYSSVRLASAGYGRCVTLKPSIVIAPQIRSNERCG